ncbi:MAG TPA: fructosamine kinase family protein [Allosphingosinicella sp.]|nr:fructosamine kinase family protein [Allosphingosinicella sp.]
MSAFSERVAQITGVPEAQLERLAGGDLSEVLLLRRPDRGVAVAKGGPNVGVEAAMLRGLAQAGVPVPQVQGEHEDVLLLEHVDSDGVFSPRAWASIGASLAHMHAQHGDRYGWPVDYSLGSVHLDNRAQSAWPAFWGEQRLNSTASLLDRPWRERVERLVAQIDDRLPQAPPPSLLHGDLWSGNILVREGQLAALLDPACYYGHAEVDLAMLTLFDSPPEEFWTAYGGTQAGWAERKPIYQLFPALVHLRLFGGGYAPLVDRLLDSLGA